MKRALICILGCWIWLLVFGLSPSYSQNVITTVAGTTWVFRGDGGPAINAPLGSLDGVAVDSAGNLLVSDPDNRLVVKISLAGVLTIVAGNGFAGFSGDGGPAVSASLVWPAGVAMDSTGNIYIADPGSSRVRKVSASGTISTVAGGGTGGDSGDGGPATNAQLNPWGLAVDAAGSLYITELNAHRVRKVTPGGTITTVAGTGSSGFAGDGGPATNAQLSFPRGLAVDASGNLYIADSYNDRVRKVTPGGTITTVAGGGAAIPGDNGPATSVFLSSPAGVAIDAGGNLYIAQLGENAIRKVNPAGVITTVAGNWQEGYSGDGGQAIAASLRLPGAVAVDSAGSLFIADTGNNRIRRVTAGGMISTIAGNGLFKFAGDGGPATSASFNTPFDVATGPGGAVYVADASNNRIRKIDSSGKVTTVAGTGSTVFSGDNGPATSATLFQPNGVAADAAGNVFIADRRHNRIRRISTAGTITTVAGTGGCCLSGDGGPAVDAYLADPMDVAVDAQGNVFIADLYNHRIRKVGANGIITTIAGSGPTNVEDGGYSGDGGPATSALLNQPYSLEVDAGGNVYVADRGNHRVRKISASGTITTVAGNGTAGFSGDGGAATSASLQWPAGVALDGAGNVYIVDSGNGRVRMVSLGGVITTVAGGGNSLANGVRATDAGLNLFYCTPCHSGLAVDAAGNLLIVETRMDQIRKVLVTAPTFSVFPLDLKFAVAAGAVGDAPQRIALVPGGTLGLAWTAQATTQSGGNWLAVSPGAGLVPDSIGVTANATNLTPGTYQGTVTVQAPLAVPSTQTVAVELTVTATLPAQLAVEPGSLTFEATTSAASNPVQTLRVGNSGGGTLNWTAKADAAWLSVSSASGSASAGSPSALQVSANLSGLAAGTYSGAVTVTSGSQTAKVGVTLLVTTVTQTILVSQTGLLFTGVQDGGVVPPQSIGILNSGQGTMNWTVEATTLGGGNWLTVTPTSGSSDASSTDVQLVEVGANTTGLAAGRYSGMIRVRSSGANNSPQIVSVELHVLAAGANPGVLVRPTGLIFAARAGSSSPASQTVRLATAATDTLEARSFQGTLDGGNWLQVLPQNLVLSASDRRTVTVQPTLGATMTPGVYRGAIALLFGDGSVQTVQVLFLVLRSASSTSGGLSLLARDERPELFDATCTATKLLAMHRTLGAGFSAAAGSPTLIEVQVADDCATAVTDATVVASFSSGDAPLVMTSLRNGTYVGTWRPLTTASQVTVTVRATLPPLTTAEVQAQGQVSGSSTMPLLPSGGIVNAASYAPAAALAPGSIVAAFGRNMATSGTTAGLPLETTLGGATLNIGGFNAPLFFSSDGQINAQLPFDLTPNSRPQAYIRLRTTSGAEMISVPEPFTIAAAQPGIFAMNQAGSGQGAIIDLSWKLVDASNPAKAGDYVQVFATGLGQVSPSVTAGQAAPGSPLSETTVAVTATVGGKAATVIFAGLAPTFAGLYQVNLQIPEGVTSGDAVPLILTQGGVSSNTVTLAIR